MNEFDDLDMIPMGPVETFAFWTCIAMMLGIFIGTASFATGLLWSDTIHPVIGAVITWCTELLA